MINAYELVKDCVDKDSFLWLMFSKWVMTPSEFSKYDRWQLTGKKKFRSEPVHYKQRNFVGKSFLYKIRWGSTVEQEYIARDCGVPYEKVEAEEREVRYDHIDLSLNKVVDEIIKSMIEDTKYYHINYDWKPAFIEIDWHTIYLNPEIFFIGADRSLETALEFFEKYNHRNCTKKAIEYLKENKQRWSDFVISLKSF